ncbi:MAG TPA: hypothetical protein VM012_00245 [Flavitalea sp.]|nr:hypothetical protein [Flavitalea sp.]
MMRPFFTVLAVFSLLGSMGQSSNGFIVPRDRMLFHDNVDRQQQKLLLPDGSLHIVEDESINLQVADALIRKVDEFQGVIEMDSSFTRQQKIKYLKSLETLVKGFYDNRNAADYPASLAPALLNAFVECVRLDQQNLSIEPVIAKSDYGIGKILVNCFVYPSENSGVANARVLLLKKYCELHPDEILPVLSRNPNIAFADNFIKIAAYRDIRRLYDYAAARNALGNRIRNHTDSLVKMVSRMALSKSGQLYFPFLDNLLTGKITFEDIDRVKDNNIGYFRLMVNTRIEYARRLLPPIRDTATEMRALTRMMGRKAREGFIRQMNALHNVNDERIRFKVLEGLTPQELYYIIVLGEDEIYTSSYLNTYKRIFQRMASPRADSLLISVQGDYFRKFIKMAAGYNMLGDFLSRMEKDNATTTMKAFVIKLETTQDLEESVDVADSYSSIMDKDSSLAKYILDEVKWNYDRNVKENNKRGIVIYNILRVLFESADTTHKSDLSTQLGIPPVYTVDYKSLTDDSGRIVQQVFFYGDEDLDGQKSFTNFMAMFRSKADWKISENANWVNISSVRGKPVIIYANKPLYGKNDPDEEAQLKLIEHLSARNLHPTIVIHRGHSYHLESTLKKLPATSRIVVLGSCGGYNNLNEVLQISEDAHIISSKQVGTKTVNEPILQAINSSLLAGKNIDWISLWKDLTLRFQKDAAKEKFDDYIPPYKNLGAIFIKAYRKAMGRQQLVINN